MELAKEFAKHKHDLVLIARNELKLNQLAEQLRQQFKAEVMVIIKDLSQKGAAAFIFNQLKSADIQIDYLVNNAGFGDFEMFIDADWNKLEEMMNLNMVTLTQFCKLFLPGMKERKGGKIMNVASTAAFQPGPTMAVYYATKAFVLHFSEAIYDELKPYNITVTALCPGPTESGFQEKADLHNSKLIKGKKLESSAEVAAYGYKAMMKGKAVAVHGLVNKLMVESIRFTPRNLVVKIVRNMQNETR
ncbi:MAG: SDR family oxidoreductase [Chitinophagales bacterium]|nr:SDR family oxidoreductase [Chitinophagales bacterium]